MPPRSKRGADPGNDRRRVRARRAPGAALPFVEFDQGRFTVNPEAVAFLHGLGDQKLAVATVAGPYRHGKSFLLKRVILQQEGPEGFQVGNTVNACTKGLHLSTELLPASNSVDGDYQVLVLDTEGLGAMTASTTHDTRIFSLGMLLSSLFVYNSKGTIDQPALNNLSLVANLSDHIRTSAGGDGDSLADFFPAFLWVVRDFGLELVDDEQQPITEQQYLENALQPIEGGDPEKEQVRACLRRFFRHRDCVTLPPPADGPALAGLDQVPLASLRPDFVQRAAELRTKLLAAARPKQALGVKVTGELLARLARVYCDAINAGAAPAIKDSWSMISADVCAEALEAAVAHFRAAVTDPGATGALVRPVDLENELAAAFASAYEVFSAAAIGDGVTGHRNKLRDRLQAVANELRTANKGAIRTAALEICREVDDALMAQPSFDAVRALFAQADARFRDQVGDDPGTLAQWHAEVVGRVWDWTGRYTARLARDHAEAAAELKGLGPLKAQAEQAAIDAQRALEAKADELAQATQAAEAAEAMLARLRAEREAERTEHEAQLAAATDGARAMEAELTERLGAAETAVVAAETAAELAQADLAQARVRVADLTAEQARGLDELQRLRADQHRALEAERAAADAVAQAADLNRRNEVLRSQLDAAATDHQAELEQLHSDTRETLAGLGRAKAEALTRATQAEHRCREAEAARDEIDHSASVAAEKATVALETAATQLTTERAQRAADHARATDELQRLRAEAATGAQRFQQQLEEHAARHRDEQRARVAEARVELDKLTRAQAEATNRAQAAEARAARLDTALTEARASLARERERAQTESTLGRVSELESKLASLSTQHGLLESSLATKSAALTEQQSRVVELEDELRRIEQRHAAEKMRLELEHARQMGAASVR
jgi:hypothetical protein